MNTVRSVGYGWGVLVAAGGGAYYFAKQRVNADREEKHQQMLQKRAINERYAELEREQIAHRNASSTSPTIDSASNPSMEASNDPAPTRHAPTSEGQKVAEKSKYEASEVWRSKKGDRLR